MNKNIDVMLDAIPAKEEKLILDRNEVVGLLNSAVQKGTYTRARHFTVNRHRKDIIKKDVVYIVKLVIGEGAFNHSLGISRQDGSQYLEAFPKADLEVTHSDLSTTTEKYARQALSVTCNVRDLELLRGLTTNGVYIEFDERGIHPIGAYTMGLNGNYIRLAGKALQPTHLENVLFYHMHIYNPGDLKQNKWSAVSASEEEAMGILHKATNFASVGLTMDQLNTGECSKKIARVSLTKTPSTLLKDDVVIGIYKDKFPTEYKNGMDGMAFVDASKLDLKGYAKGESLAGIGLQLRTAPVMTKVFALAVNKVMFRCLVETLVATGKLYIPEGKSLDDLEMLVDANGVKLDNSTYNDGDNTYTTKVPNTLRLLDMPSSNEANTCMQLFEKLVGHNNEEGVAKMQELLRAGVANELESRFVKQGAIPRLGEVDKSRYSAYQLVKMAPEAKHRDRGLMYTTIQQTMDAVQTTINKMKTPIKGSLFARAMADFSFMLLGESIIRFGEYYSNDGTEQVFFVKYPAMGDNEKYVCRNMKGDMVNRLANIVMKHQTARILENALQVAEFFASLSESIICMPGSEILRLLEAGFDFDYDGGAVVPVKGMEKIFGERQRRLIVKIKREDPKDNVDEALAKLAKKGYREIKATRGPRIVPLGSEIIIETYKKIALSPRIGVGPLTNQNSTEVHLRQSILFYLKTGQAEKAQQLLRVAREMIRVAANVQAPGKEDYTPMPSYESVEDGEVVEIIEVDNNFGLEMIRRIQNTNLDSAKNLLAILKDLNALRRSQQEGTIDSDKDGMVVRIDLWVTGFRAKDLIPFEYDLNGMDGSVTMKRTAVSKKTKLFDTIYSDLQDELVDEVTMFAKANFVPLYASAGFAEDELNHFSLVAQHHSKVFSNLVMLKYHYERFNSVIMAERNLATDEAVQEDLSDHLTMLRSMLNGMASAAMNNLDTDTASKLAVAASCYNSGRRVLENTRHRFAQKVMPELYFHYMLSTTPDAVTYEAERFYGTIADEEHGVVANLVSGRANEVHAFGFTESDFTGEVTIQKAPDGKLYAARSVEVKRTSVDKVPVVMTTQETSVATGDKVIFVKEQSQYVEYKAYKVTLIGGNVASLEAVGRIDQRSLVSLSTPGAELKVYTVTGTFRDKRSVTVNGRVNSYDFNCFFVK